jgi:hypothetical protein
MTKKKPPLTPENQRFLDKFKDAVDDAKKEQEKPTMKRIVERMDL